MAVKIRVVHPDPNASISIGDPDGSGGFLISPEAVSDAVSHGFQVSHTVETDHIIRGETDAAEEEATLPKKVKGRKAAAPVPEPEENDLDAADVAREEGDTDPEEADETEGEGDDSEETDPGEADAETAPVTKRGKITKKN